MIGLKKLTVIAMKWRKMAGVGRRSIALPGISNCKQANKGHFVVYSTDLRRFVIPLAYLHTNIFRELFEMSEEEFGLPTDGPIILPCNAAFLEYVIYIDQNPASKNFLKALLVFMFSSKCSAAAASYRLISPSPITIHNFS